MSDPMLTPAIQQEFLERVKADAATLAVSLREATDAGVKPMLIMPQLVLVFREAFGEMPPGFAMPGMPS
jgi:hypothetical protein